VLVSHKPGEENAVSDRAAIVTGASSGIGLELARMLGSEGYGLTVASRQPEKLSRAAGTLRDEGYYVHDVAAALQDEAEIRRVVASHRERFGRLDVLVNNAGVGHRAPIDDYATKTIDLQLSVNLRSTIIFYRECVELLRAAAADRGSALVINSASLYGKHGQPWLSVYSATKAGVIRFTEAMNRELAADGIRSCALCPSFVDTPMTDYAKDTVPAEDMIRTTDVAEMARALLRLSPRCIVPEISFMRPGEGL
jgi:NAD(P)-dependent dehydrogenase (short-subunit alcohol dehydrogenase family)